jgi:hypothetical protein
MKRIHHRLLPGVTILAAFASSAVAEPVARSSRSDAYPSSAVIITAPTTLGGAYQQPAWADRSRSSATTDAYVLSPFNVYVGATLNAVTPKHGKNVNRLTPEIEIGLPHRFQAAVETDIAQTGSRVENKFINLEMRYAFADWGKIPLNPTLFVEWKFGTGNERETESEREEEGAGDEEADASPSEEAERGAESTDHRRPDSLEVRLLLSQNFTEHVEWAFNGFWEQEVGLDREREIGFSQSLVYSHGTGRIKTGVEMQFIATTKKDTRDDPSYSFVVGPSCAVQLTRHCRLDLAPLFGIGRDSPRISAFAVFSCDFGGQGESEAQAPVSTRNR